MSAFEIRPRSATEIVDAAFEILRRDYLTLITMTAAVQLPVIMLQLALRNRSHRRRPNVGTEILAALLLVFAAPDRHRALGRRDHPRGIGGLPRAPDERRPLDRPTSGAGSSR